MVVFFLFFFIGVFKNVWFYMEALTFFICCLPTILSLYKVPWLFAVYLVFLICVAQKECSPSKIPLMTNNVG